MESVSVSTLAQELLAQAREASSGRSAHSINAGPGRGLRQTILALTAGRELAEHDSPGEATLQILQGKVRLIAGPDVWEGSVGDQVAIPAERHSLVALEDAAVLLTVALSR